MNTSSRARVRLSTVALWGALSVAGVVQAADDASGWYIEGAATYSMLKDARGTVANTVFAGGPPTTLHLVNNVNDGWGGLFAFGYRAGRFRLEGEIGRTTNDGDSYTTLTPVQGTFPMEGKFDVTRYMVNTHLELGGGRWNPHLGIGVGKADVRLWTFGAPAAAPNIPPRALIDDSDTVLAYQLIAGVAYDLRANLALTARYRWFETADPEGLDSRGERISREMSGHNLDIGLRYRF